MGRQALLDEALRRRWQLHGVLDADDVKPEVELPSTYAMHPDLFLDSCSS
jgi:hypothetical protein